MILPSRLSRRDRGASHSGPGAARVIYEEALGPSSWTCAVSRVNEVEVEVVYKGHLIRGQRIDLLVAGEVVRRNKIRSQSFPMWLLSQLLSYLESNALAARIAAELRLCSDGPDGVKRVSL